MTTTPQHDDAWDACPSGEIDGLVNHLRQKKQQQKLQKLSAVGGVLLVLLVFGFWVSNSLPHESTHGGIACSEVKERARQYISESLSKEMMGRIDAHLAACPRCEEAIAQLRANTESSSSESESFEVSTVQINEDFARRLMAATW